jgi:hypothetical protein
MTDNERKETISALRQLLAMCDFVDQYGDSIDADPYFNAVETAIESLNETRWIPVSERLPENSGCVLISIAGDIEFGAYDRQNSDWAIWQGDYWGEGKRADAWMPLPEPYREDGE